MAIIVSLDRILERRNVTSRALAQAIGLSETNVSLIRSGKVKGMRFSTLERICQFLDCQPADILSYAPELEEIEVWSK